MGEGLVKETSTRKKPLMKVVYLRDWGMLYYFVKHSTRVLCWKQADKG